MTDDLPAYVRAGYKHEVSRPNFVAYDEDEYGEDLPPRMMTPAERRQEVARCARLNATRNWFQFVRTIKSLAAYDDILKCYYPADAIGKHAFAPNPFFAFLRKA